VTIGCAKESKTKSDRNKTTTVKALQLQMIWTAALCSQ